MLSFAAINAFTSRGKNSTDMKHLTIAVAEDDNGRQFS